MQRRLLVPLMLVVTAMTGAAQTTNVAPNFVPLFPEGVPEGKRDLGPEKDMTTAKDNLIMGRPLIRLGNVSDPSIAFYPAAAANNSGVTVIVFPGGGYSILALDLEGTEICQWLNSIGVNAALVKYRVPEPAGMPRYQEPLEDARQAVTYVRNKSAEWHVDSQKVGVLGFSAGGHLAALISNVDDAAMRPNFAVLIYPAYLAVGEKLDTLAAEVKVTANTSPSFIIQTEDDPVHVENSLIYYRALKDAKVPSEMHVFSTGGHGYGMRTDPHKPVTEWPRLAEAWMRSRSLIK